MIGLYLGISGADGIVKAESSENDRLYLVYDKAYEQGDEIVLGCSQENAYLVVQLEDAMDPAFVYLAGKSYRFSVPFGEKRASYSPKAFVGDCHVLTARLASQEEVSAYKNVALNGYDQHGNSTCFPHAFANVETRGESVFAARNAINGNQANHAHGSWPFESWGINRREDAKITVDFGRTVEIDKVVLTLRADFPHDNYWKHVTLFFSDGSREGVHLTESRRPQSISLEPRLTDWIALGELLKSDDPSPFPALTQMEVYGREAPQS